MSDLVEALATAFRLVVELDADLTEIVALSLRVSHTWAVRAATLAQELRARNLI